ncbi:hypothetical protein G7Z17_g1554 [Cylindrodendrum hubeiense]|uniref:Uncharacterized protein n=1 Tax=Cylindrodendrum hubeiense TaxID=595255 RepID=A0A9P5HKL4_9HYPO|nr:hypothetical protein G7Z17_g1554 [Cylindrodendrum hubeiense]
MTDIIATAKSVLQVLDRAARLIKRARAAVKAANNLAELMERYANEVQQTQDWINNIILTEDRKIPQMEQTIQKIHNIALQLKKHLAKMIRKRGKSREFLHQFTSGEDERVTLDNIMRDITYAKIDLIVRVQPVLIGISKSIQNTVILGAEAIKGLDAKLPEGRDNGGRYPKLSKILQKRKPNVDGTLTLSKEDLDNIEEEDRAVTETPGETRWDPNRPTKEISSNHVGMGCFVVTGPQGEGHQDPWRDANVLITGNDIKDNVCALLGANNSIEALKMLVDLRKMEIQHGSGNKDRGLGPGPGPGPGAQGKATS